MTGDIPPTTVGNGSQLRTLAVRITEDLRAQLDVLAQLTGRSTTEEIRLALEHWIVKSKSDPSVLKQAEAVKAEIEREAQTRRNAIAAIFEGDGTNAYERGDHDANRHPLPARRAATTGPPRVQLA